MDDKEQKPMDIILNDREIKQEAMDLLENVKEEPIEENEYSELITPKLEEVIKPSTTYMSNDPVQKALYNTQETFPNLDVELPTKSLKRYRCSVCSQSHTRISMKYTTIKEDKLIIMLGCILHGTYTLDQAQWFMSGRGILYICYAHFSEAISQIFNSLNIRNNVELTSYSSDLMDNLMTTVSTIYRQIETAQFCDILHKFVRRNISRKRKPHNTNSEDNKKQSNYQCQVCKQSQISNKLKHISMQDEELVLMIGCILCGEYTLEQAHYFISRKTRSSVCHIHFSQSIDVIYKALDIKQSDEVYSCSSDLMANLMVTVNELCPGITTSTFYQLFNEFVMRNKQFLKITPTTMEFEQQKPKNVLLDREINQEKKDYLENVKEESIEEDNFEKIIPKEEVMEPSSSNLSAQEMHQLNPVQRLYMQTHKVFPTLYVEPQNKKQYSQRSKCSVCLQKFSRKRMKNVTIEEDKLVIMLGCILRGDWFLDQAQLFMSAEGKVNICYDHFSESINEIYGVLNIKNSDELLSCSSDLMDNLMVTVNTLNPQIETLQFCDIICKSVRRNIEKREHIQSFQH